MQANNTRTMYILLGIAVLVILGGVLLLLARGSSNNATPTVSVDAIYTAAFQTFEAQQATQQALIPPAETPLPSPAATSTQPFAFPTSVLASPTSGLAQGCDNSAFVSDITIPDNTNMTPGQTFTKTWAVQNSGTCAWSTSYKLMFVFGTALDGTSVAIPQSVAPGAQTQISVNLVASATPGKYTSNWKLQNDKGQYFGTYLTVVINVLPATATSTASTSTPTSTSTPANTPTKTPTKTPTFTPTP